MTADDIARRTHAWREAQQRADLLVPMRDQVIREAAADRTPVRTIAQAVGLSSSTVSSIARKRNR